MVSSLRKETIVTTEGDGQGNGEGKQAGSSLIRIPFLYKDYTGGTLGYNDSKWKRKHSL